MARKRKRNNKNFSNNKFEDEENEYITFDENKRKDFLTGFHKRKLEKKQRTIDRINKRIKMEEQEAKKERRKSERDSKLKILHTLEHIEKVQKVIEGAPIDTLNSDDESNDKFEGIQNKEINTEEIKKTSISSDDTHKKNIESISEYKGNKTLTTVTTVSGFDISNPLADFEDEINELNDSNKKGHNNNYENEEIVKPSQHKEYLIKSIKQKKKHNNSVKNKNIKGKFKNNKKNNKRRK
ncbi:hypothetical protein H8356DRAFT_1710341 [Neocallimastix lanati (nom. inval.)]|jgi:ribosomal RNA-processing protein 17|nr:hypothetical protein H8356DRAFT_1710341 [Neocallimastix sp. JGI-2020a]